MTYGVDLEGIYAILKLVSTIINDYMEVIMMRGRLYFIMVLLVCCAMIFTSCDIVRNIIPGLDKDGGNEPEVICSDTNGDHLCDDCGKALGECKDENEDHKCDVCSKTVSVCEEGDSHKCSICSAVMSVCADNSFDHRCDVCNKTLSSCYDTVKRIISATYAMPPSVNAPTNQVTTSATCAVNP